MTDKKTPVKPQYVVERLREWQRRGWVPPFAGDDDIPPHNLDAEQGVLACILLEGREIISELIASNLTPKDFFELSHEIIFATMLSLFEEGKEINEIELCEKFRKNGTLETIGGPGYLDELGRRIQVSTGLEGWVNIIFFASAKRKLLREANKIIYGTRTAENDNDLEEIIKNFSPHIASGGDIWLEKILEENRTPDVIPHEETILLLKGFPIMTEKNIGTISAKSKSGKSSVVSAIISALLHSQCNENIQQQYDFLGFSANNTEGKLIVHIDTEQSPHDAAVMISNALRRCGLSKRPPNLISVSLAHESAPNILRFIDEVLKKYAPVFGGVAQIIIDGAADLVKSINDEVECNLFIKRIIGIAKQYETTVLNVIHTNEKDESMTARGWLGMNFMRKCQAFVMLEKEKGDEGITNMWTEKARGRGVFRNEAVKFMWNENEGMHTTFGFKKVEIKKEFSENNEEISFYWKKENARIVTAIFAGKEGMRKGEVISAMIALEYKEKGKELGAYAADKRFQRLLKYGHICYSGNGLYFPKDTTFDSGTGAGHTETCAGTGAGTGAGQAGNGGAYKAPPFPPPPPADEDEPQF